MIDDERERVNAIVVNLARRSRLLVERQLRLLDELERDERDPDRLAALFQLDQLAAKLRRNDENLLVVAGGQVRLRPEPDGGVPLHELVFAAVSDVEAYQRIRCDVDNPTPVGGHAAPDLIHLLAELLDNAAAFSPPGSPITVTCRDTGDDAAEIQIADAGIGLGPGALVEANALLATPPDLSLAVSERMGLVVASHLAARHHVRVSLDSSSAGTVAFVRIPSDLLTRKGTT